MNNEYKTIPFADVKIGQEFEDVEDEEFDGVMTLEPYIKRAYTCATFRKGCLVRTADCDELDFDTWWEREHSNEIWGTTLKEIARTAWENGAYKAKA